MAPGGLGGSGGSGGGGGGRSGFTSGAGRRRRLSHEYYIAALAVEKKGFGSLGQ